MKTTRKPIFSKRVIVIQSIGFLLLIIFIWINELLDIPHLLFKVKPTPFNWSESLIESICIGVLGSAIAVHTEKMFKKVKFLEGIIPICASCKKIRDEKGQWHQFESYIHNKSEAEFSHSYCPMCMENLFPELELHKKE